MASTQTIMIINKHDSSEMKDLKVQLQNAIRNEWGQDAEDALVKSIKDQEKKDGKTSDEVATSKKRSLENATNPIAKKPKSNSQIKRAETIARKKAEHKKKARVLLQLLHTHFNTDGTVRASPDDNAVPFDEFSGKILNRMVKVWTQMSVVTGELAKQVGEEEKKKRNIKQLAKLKEDAEKSAAAYQNMLNM